MPRLPNSPPGSREPERPHIRLTPIGAAIAVLLALAISLAIGLVWLAQVLFQLRGFGQYLDVIKIVLTIVGGIGGVVALVVAYRKQRLAEAAQRLDEHRQQLAEAGEDRERSTLYAERFDRASDKLGSDSAAVRLAGVHALANLADDWEYGRQTCIDVLCAYLRMPPGPEPAPDDSTGSRTDWLAMREVRATILRLIGAHLKRDASPAWHGCRLDFTGVTFDANADFRDAVIGSGSVIFDGADFAGGRISFVNASFSGGTVFFRGVKFSGGMVSFFGADFSDGVVYFSRSEFSGGLVIFRGANFSGSEVSFAGATFSRGRLTFGRSKFSGGRVAFDGARFVGGDISFANSIFSGALLTFRAADVSGTLIHFDNALFSSGTIDFSEVVNWWRPPVRLPLQPTDVLLCPPDGRAYPPPPASSPDEAAVADLLADDILGRDKTTIRMRSGNDPNEDTATNRTRPRSG